MLYKEDERKRKVTIFLFVDVALRAASILTNLIFYIYLVSSRWQNTFIWLDLSIGSMLEVLVLKNGVECTTTPQLKSFDFRKSIEVVTRCANLINATRAVAHARNVPRRRVADIAPNEIRIMRSNTCL